MQNPLFWVIFEELPFCHSPPPNNYIRGRLSNLVGLSFEHISFSNKRKTTILFPSPLTFLQWPIRDLFSYGFARKLLNIRKNIFVSVIFVTTAIFLIKTLLNFEKKNKKTFLHQYDI